MNCLCAKSCLMLFYMFYKVWNTLICVVWRTGSMSLLLSWENISNLHLRYRLARLKAYFTEQEELSHRKPVALEKATTSCCVSVNRSTNITFDRTSLQCYFYSAVNEYVWMERGYQNVKHVIHFIILMNNKVIWKNMWKMDEVFERKYTSFIGYLIW